MSRRPPQILAPVAAFLVAALAIAATGCASGTRQEEPAPSSGEVSLRLLSPAAGDTLPGPAVEVRFELSGYEVYFDSTKKMGQHIHFILDNEPYIPHYTTQPFVFPNVAPGTHTRSNSWATN